MLCFFRNCDGIFVLISLITGRISSGENLLPGLKSAVRKNLLNAGVADKASHNSLSSFFAFISVAHRFRMDCIMAFIKLLLNVLENLQYITVGSTKISAMSSVSSSFTAVPSLLWILEGLPSLGVVLLCSFGGSCWTEVSAGPSAGGSFWSGPSMVSSCPFVSLSSPVVVPVMLAMPEGLSCSGVVQFW